MPTEIYDLHDEEETYSNAEIVNNDSFERLLSRKKRKSLDEWLFILTVLLVLCALLFIVSGLIFFRAKTVLVQGGSYYDNDDILAACGITEKDNLFFVDKEELEESLTLHFPYIESITIERKLPTTLIIKIHEDQPKYYMTLGDEAFLLSESLRVLHRGDSIEQVTKGIDGLYRVTLPTVTYAVEGRKLQFQRASTYQYLIDFLSLLDESEFGDNIDHVNIESKFRIHLFLYDHRYKVIFGTAEEAEEKLLFFKNIREQKLDPNAFAVIDVTDLDRAFVSIKDGAIEE